MKIAVTGGPGFIGRYVINHLTAGGHSVRAWRRAESDLGGFDEPKAIEWIDGDLSDAASAGALVRGMDAVVHLALSRARGAFRAGEGDLPAFAEVNIVGSLRLMEAARAAGVGRFIQTSTCAVHDRILDDRPLDEAHPLWPHSHYGAHKAALEKFVHSFGFGTGWAICAIRPTGVYGLRRPVEASKWYRLVRQVVEGRDVETSAGGKEVHAADVARAIGILLEAPAEAIAGEAFNCYDQYIADQDVALIAREISGSGSKIATPNTGPKNQISTEKLANLGMRFGGRALLEETVKQLVAAVKSGG